MVEGGAGEATDGSSHQMDEKSQQKSLDVESGRTPAVLTVSSLVDTGGKPEQTFTPTIIAQEAADAIVNRSVRPSSRCLSSAKNNNKRRNRCGGLCCCGFGACSSSPPTTTRPGCCSGPATTGVQVILAAAIILVGLVCAGLLFGYLRCQQKQRATHERLQGLEEQRVRFEAQRQTQRLQFPHIQQQPAFLAPRRPHPHFRKPDDELPYLDRKRPIPLIEIPPAELQSRRADESDEDTRPIFSDDGSSKEKQKMTENTFLQHAAVRKEVPGIHSSDGRQGRNESTKEAKSRFNSTIIDEGSAEEDDSEQQDTSSYTSPTATINVNASSYDLQQPQNNDHSTNGASSQETIGGRFEDPLLDISSNTNTTTSQNATDENQDLLSDLTNIAHHISPVATIPPNDCGPGYVKDPAGKCRPVVHAADDEEDSSAES